jgi:arylsulfatase A-like enzyme
MGRRWWLLFRSLAVPTVLFLAPALAVQELHPLSYLLSTRGAAAEIALEISAVLLIEACCAAFLTLVLTAGRLFGLWLDRADRNCAGILTLAGAIMFVLALLYPLETFVGRVVGAGVQAIIVLTAAALVTAFGWRRAFAQLDRLNQSAQAILILCPLILLAAFTGGFGWRSFDRIPLAHRSGADPPAMPNVVMVSFDAMSAQDMSLYGYKIPTTPQFERLARRGYNFVNFASTSDFTSPAAASLITGQYPLRNRVFQLYGHVPHRLRHQNLAWVLKQHGYSTAAIVTNPAAHPLCLRLEDSFSILPRPPVSGSNFPGNYLLQLRHSTMFNAVNGVAVNGILRDLGFLFGRFNHSGAVIPDAVFASAESLIGGLREPYFLWIHVYPPHAPYITDARFQGRFLPGTDFTTQAQYFWEAPGAQYPAPMQHRVDLLRLRYDESVAECDAALGKFLDWMAANRRDEHAIIIVTADHGENFSRGWWSHESPNLHYAETHIPLVISLPGENRAYSESQDADLTDVAPTLLAILGIAQPPWMDGHPLIGASSAPALASQPSFSMYLAESDSYERATAGAIAVNSGAYHLVWYFPSGGVELFDILRDPEENQLMFAGYPPYPPGIAMALVGEIQRRFIGALNGVPQAKR